MNKVRLQGEVLRDNLQRLLSKTLIWKYSLPDEGSGIDGVNLSTWQDDAFLCTSNENLVKVIYNSIIEYSFNEFDIVDHDYSSLLAVALRTKIKYKEWQEESTKIKYGFYGEVLLYAMLFHFYQSKPLISRGYFYNPLENSETKGYDSYHLLEKDGKVDLWFGEVKFRNTLASCAKSAIEGLDKALSDDYLSENILAMENFRNNFSIKNSKIEEILNSWRKNPLINLIDEIKKYDLKLVYPVLLVYPDKAIDFNTQILNTIEHINSHYSTKKYDLSIDYELFFILLPLSEIKKIKQDVIEWIELKKPLLS